MIMHGLLFFADHLIEFMGAVLVTALIVRWVAYKASNRDLIYFKTFSRSVEKVLENQDKFQEVHNVDGWLNELLGNVLAQLPERSLRAGRQMKATEAAPGQSFRFQGKQKESLQEFAEGKKSVIHAVKHQVDAFKSPFPPNFTELTYRILGEDKQWRQVLGMPVDMLVRMMDILPGIFVVFGIFGTFIGIATALPMIGALDMGHIQDSGPVLTRFIDAVSMSMRCSIAGIFCSIFMTVLNALYPLYTSRAEVRRSLERCLENMWYRIHGTKVSAADAQIIKLLERLATAWEGGASNSSSGPRRVA
jgi:hypothetical protein